MPILSKIVLYVLFITCYSMSSTYDEIKNYLEKDENIIDIGIGALILAKDVYPNLNVEQYSSLIDKMVIVASNIRSMEQPRFKHRDIEKINVFLYLSGPWNSNHAWKYDSNFDDSIVAMTNWLPYYIDNRLGNCVSMPTLWLAIGQRMGMPVFGALAPQHIYVKYDNGEINSNVETTGVGGNTSDSMMQSHILDRNPNLITGGSYYRKLSKKEYIASIMVNNAIHVFRINRDSVLAKKYLTLSLRYNSKIPEAYYLLYRITKIRYYLDKGNELGGMTKIQYSDTYLKWKDETK